MINNAIGFTVKAHQGQVRKGTDMPYIKHPMHVGMLLTQIGAEDEVVIAGILHDVLEDTSVTPDEIRTEFGEKVLDLINGASEPDKSLSWRERKEHTIHYLKTAPRDVQLISLCDKYSNLSDMAKDLMKEGPGFWHRFNAGVGEQKWYYESLVQALNGVRDIELHRKFSDLVNTVFGEL